MLVYCWQAVRCSAKKKVAGCMDVVSSLLLPPACAFSAFSLIRWKYKKVGESVVRMRSTSYHKDCCEDYYKM